jgi:hypothetical protein
MQKGHCKHCRHEGLKIICEKGLDPVAMAKAAALPGEDHKLGLMYRIPCSTRERNLQYATSPGQLHCLEQKATCDQYEDPTDQEIKDHEAAMDAMMKRFEMTLPLIDRIKKAHNESWSGIEECPICKGKLHLRLNCFGSFKGRQKHLHGQCETKGCLAWAE